MIILRKFIRNSICCFCFCFITKAHSQNLKLFINGRHEYKKTSSFELYYNEEIIYAKKLDSLLQSNSDLPVRLKIKIGHDTIISDTFALKRYFKISEIITGFSNNLNKLKRLKASNEELFEEEYSESYLPFILHYYKLFDKKNKRQNGIKYFIIKFNDTYWIKTMYKYSSYW